MEEIHNNKYRLTVIIAAVVVLTLAIVVGIILFCKSTKAAPSEPTEVIEATQETMETMETEAPVETTEATEATENTTATEPYIPVVKPTESTEAATEETVHIEMSEVPSEAPSAPERGLYPIDAPTNDRERLACVIYQEAGGNAICDNCRKYVGDVVLNRVNDPRFPNSIEGVLLQSGQYGRFSWTGIVWQSRAHNAGEKAAVERAYHVADELLAGNHSELYGNGYVWQAGFVQGSGFWCCGHYFGR